MNNFPAMTEERRQDLIELCESVIAGHVQYGGDSNEEDIYKIALAALTAEPAGKFYAGPRGKVSIHPSEALPLGFNPFYTAPPAPVLKPIELNKGALMISAYTTDPMNEDPVLCLSKDLVIEAIRAAGYEVKQ